MKNVNYEIVGLINVEIPLDNQYMDMPEFPLLFDLVQHLVAIARIPWFFLCSCLV